MCDCRTCRSEYLAELRAALTASATRPGTASNDRSVPQVPSRPAKPSTGSTPGVAAPPDGPFPLAGKPQDRLRRPVGT